MKVKVEVVRDGEVLEEDVASGNTRRTAMAAANALGRQTAMFYEGASYKLTPMKEA